MIKGVGKDEEIVFNEQGGKQSKLSYRFDLIPAKPLFKLAEVFALGAEKYSLNNWHKISRHEHLNHAEAHLQAYKAGDVTDEHLEHAFCRLCMALAVNDDSYPYGDVK